MCSELIQGQVNVFHWLLYIKIWWAWVGWHAECLCDINSAQHY